MSPIISLPGPFIFFLSENAFFLSVIQHLAMLLQHLIELSGKCLLVVVPRTNDGKDEEKGERKFTFSFGG